MPTCILNMHNSVVVAQELVEMHRAGGAWGAPRIIADEVGSNQLSNHGMIQLDDGRIMLGISHYRNVRPMTSDLDMAIFDELWLQGGIHHAD